MTGSEVSVRDISQGAGPGAVICYRASVGTGFEVTLIRARFSHLQLTMSTIVTVAYAVIVCPGYVDL